jgi:hypothetical protein
MKDTSGREGKGIDEWEGRHCFISIRLDRLVEDYLTHKHITYPVTEGDVRSLGSLLSG